MKKPISFAVSALLGLTGFAAIGLTAATPACGATVNACTNYASKPWGDRNNLHGLGGHAGCSTTTNSLVLLKHDKKNLPDSVLSKNSARGAKVDVFVASGSPTKTHKYYTEVQTTGKSIIQSGRLAW